MKDFASHAPNRLALETSPYLKQHANNPVDWYPWGEEALARAKREDKPILLSIGYSACHWCHVMQHESFENEDIAALMNKHFVNIKVDREERPDLDHIYQLVVQMMGRSGGWPLTVFLLPDLRPFFGGTYYPPVPRYGVPAFPGLLMGIEEAFRQRRQDVENSADEFLSGIKHISAPRSDRNNDKSSADVGEHALGTAARRLVSRFDDVHGGFGSAPKFPSTMNLALFLMMWRRTGDAEWLSRVTKSLDAMRAGGVYDQLGGGFHRYSTDAHWLVPHFEKMLYDNALLIKLYTDGWRATRSMDYAQTVEQTLTYVMREMRDASGGFYAAQDADSEGGEGNFFVWTEAQLDALLEDDAPLAKRVWGVTESGNFEHGKSALFRAERLDDASRQLGISLQDAESLVARCRTKLFAAREKRPRPSRDEKIITSWNGLMISAFVDAGLAFSRPEWIKIGCDALDFIRTQMWKDGVLYRVHAHGKTSSIEAFLEDYAALANAALDLFEATFNASHLAFARALIDAGIKTSWDHSQKVFFTGPQRDDVLLRTQDLYDNAIPSGTSQMIHALLRAFDHSQHEQYRIIAEAAIGPLLERAIEEPFAFPYLLSAIDRANHGSTEITFNKPSSKNDNGLQSLIDVANATYVTHRLSRVADVQGDIANAVVCIHQTCSLPVDNGNALEQALESLKKGTP